MLARMEQLGESHGGWINFDPEVEEDDEPAPPTGLGAIFSTAVHQVPVCTWVAGKVSKHGIEPDSLGIQHATGTRAVARLAERGVPIPDGWRWMQDHPRRGLVVLVPHGTPYADEMRWLLRAGTTLSTVRLTGEWEARIRHGS